MEQPPEQLSQNTSQAQGVPARLEQNKILAVLNLESRPNKIMLVSVLTLVFVVVVISFLLLPPFDFPLGKSITIKKGASLGEVSLIFKDANLIRSRTLFEFCVISSRGDKGVIAGEYLFKEPVSACTLALRVVKGQQGLPVIKITIPEGTSNAGIAEILKKNLPHVDLAIFLENAREHEGFLYPETYFFLSNATAAQVENALSIEFQKKTAPLEAAIKESKHSLREIVIMASILEKEARTPEDQALVSGILWRRIALGMPLQVDATFLYLLGKKSNELTPADLSIRSAYNTYRNKGLPAGPIGNPGMNAISAAIHPVVSPYLYYLSDGKGMMHYAKTFTEHKANKEKYLK